MSVAEKQSEDAQRPIRVALFVRRLQDNALGRAYFLWQLAQVAGMSVEIFSAEGDEVWGPLAGTPFAADCHSVLADGDHPGFARFDLVIAVKPLPESFGIAERIAAASGTPLMIDVDDPDLEYELSLQYPLRRLGKLLLRGRRSRALYRARRRIRSYPTITSNPWLHARYGGIVIPHAREDTGPGRPHAERPPVIAFVGTNRPHKGVDELRAAVAATQAEGYSLTITDDPPHDAQPWERWVGSGNTLDEGLEMVRGSDVVVTPNRDGEHGRGQLPAKLIDAMLLGRAIVVTDVEPMPWAIGDAGLVARAGSAQSLSEALRRLADPALRERLGAAARERALRLFSLEANAPVFEEAVRSAIATGLAPAAGRRHPVRQSGPGAPAAPSTAA